jgi:hypothetical protein
VPGWDVEQSPVSASRHATDESSSSFMVLSLPFGFSLHYSVVHRIDDKNKCMPNLSLTNWKLDIIN